MVLGHLYGATCTWSTQVNILVNGAMNNDDRCKISILNCTDGFFVIFFVKNTKKMQLFFEIDYSLLADEQ